MGGSQGRLVTPDEARKRFSTVELRMLHAGFERLSRASPQFGPSEIGFMVFKTLVLADFSDFPETLALRMFSVFDTNRNRTLDWNELLCGLCVLCRGKHEERLRFLFQVYDEEGTGTLSRRSLLRFADLLDDHRLGDDERRSSYDLIDMAFRNSRGGRSLHASDITLESFNKCMVHFMNAPLVGWPTRVGQKLLGPIFIAAAQGAPPPSPLLPRRQQQEQQQQQRLPRRGPAKHLGVTTKFPSESAPPLPPRPEEVNDALMRPALMRFETDQFAAARGPHDSLFGDVPPPHAAALVRHQSSRAQLMEGATFKRLHRSPDRELLVTGSVWYVVSATWFRAWQSYSGFCDGDIDFVSLRSGRQLQRPGPIDNRDIIRPLRPDQDCADPSDLDSLGFCSLRPELAYQRDFVILCQEAWEFLHAAYGGGPVLDRRVIPGETARDRPEIELFPVSLNVRCVTFSSEYDSAPAASSARSIDAEQPARIQVSRKASVRDLERAILDRVMESRPRAPSTDSLYSSQSSAAEDGAARTAAALQNQDRFSAERMRIWCVLDDGPESLSEAFAAGAGPAPATHKPNLNVKLLQDPRETVEEADLEDEQTILLELSSADGNWPLASIETLRSLQPRDSKMQLAPHAANDRVVMLGGGPSSRERSTSKLASRRPASALSPVAVDAPAGTSKLSPETPSSAGAGMRAGPGARHGHGPHTQVLGNVGMANLGNTCFMSASLQCLIHTEALKQYILEDAYVSDVNTSIRDSTHGRLADAFADIFRTAWGVNGPVPTSIAPRRFKRELAKHDPRFVGVQQQDAQELLSSLLDGLAQDLNRVRSKAYVELKDSDGRADEEVAREWWMAHLRRELSIVTALFSGQFKTLLRCNTCGYESARFEPFYTLSLPLPESPKRTVTIHVVFADAARPPLLVAMRLDKTGTFGDVRRALLEMQPGANGSIVQSFLGGASPRANADEVVEQRADRVLTSERLLLAYVFERQIYSVIPDGRPLETLRARDPLYAFELPHVEHEDGFSGARLMPKKATADEAEDGDEAAADGDEEPQQSVAPPPIDVGSQVAYYTSDGSARPMLGVVVGLKGTTSKKQGGLAKYEVKFSMDANDLNDTRTIVLTSDEVQALPMKPSLLKIEQRVWHRHACYFVNPMRVVTVGMPFVLVACPDKLSGRALYEAVARQVRPSCVRDNEGDGAGALETIGAAGAEASAAASRRAKTASEIRAAWGFIIVVLGGERGRSSCGSCSWMSACDGCPLQPSSVPVSVMMSGPSTLAVDWGSAQSTKSSALTLTVVDKHSSVDDARLSEQKRMPLSSLLENFVKKEQLTGVDQARCARCKDFQDHSMTLGLWRAPPVLVIHLKRFDRSRKLLNLVDYPTKDLDLSDYLARAMPAQPQKSRKSLSRALRKKRAALGSAEQGEEDVEEEEEVEDEDDPLPEDMDDRRRDSLSRAEAAPLKASLMDEDEADEAASVAEDSASEASGRKSVSEASEASVPKTLTPAQQVAAEAEVEALEAVERLVDSDFLGVRAYGGHEHGGIPPEYDLYGVVDHSGSLGGGHYIAKTKSSIDGKWYNFDDRIVTEISEEDAVSSGAYLLFYVRKDVAANPDVGRLFPCEVLDAKTLKLARKALGPNNSSVSDRCSVM